jgi:hypothetical protein
MMTALIQFLYIFYNAFILFNHLIYYFSRHKIKPYIVLDLEYHILIFYH